MPYRAHFGLKDHPFSLTPDTSLYFPGPAYQEIRTSVLYAIERGEGIVKVVGEIGTGKTMLCRLILSELDPKAQVAYLNNPQSDRHWVIRAVCREFGIAPGRDEDPYHALNDFLIGNYANGRSAVVLVDEAQALGAEGLEAIRLLSNLETDKRKLLQVVLFGQSELDRLLERHELRQVAQRVAFSFKTRALTKDEAINYVRSRLIGSACDPAEASMLFDESGLRLLARASGGNPRAINILADKSLLAAFAAGVKRVRKSHVRAAIAESPAQSPSRWSWFRARFGLRAAASVGSMAVAAIVSALWFVWSGSG